MTEIDKQITDWVNSLSFEQMVKIYDVIQPISGDERIELDAMSDDDLLRELGVEL